jgi:hypothetical protein
MSVLSLFIREILREHMTRTMSDISEEHYAAGWMIGLETVLWNAIQRLPEPTDYGMGTIDVKRLQHLKEVSDLLGEWTDGKRFIPLAEWRSEHPGSPAWSLHDACGAAFGGVAACSPKNYGRALARISEMTGRPVDTALLVDVINELKTLPCPMD